MMHYYLIFAVTVGIIVPVCGIVYLIKMAGAEQAREEERQQARIAENKD